jgi:transcription termination factor Rho
MSEEENKQPKKEKIMSLETAETSKPTVEKKATQKRTSPAAQKQVAAENTLPKENNPSAQVSSPVEKKPSPVSHLTPPPLVKIALENNPQVQQIAAKPAFETPAAIPSHVNHNNNSANHKNSHQQQIKGGHPQRKKGGNNNFQNNRRHTQVIEDSPTNFFEQEMPKIPEGLEATYTKISDLQRMSFDELIKYAKHIGLETLTNMNRSEIVFAIVKAKIHNPAQIILASGTLEILPDGFGFLRSPQYNYLSSAEDIYVSPAQINHYGLRKGDEVHGPIRIPNEKDKYFALLRVESINGLLPKDTTNRKSFVNFTPIHPNERLMVETSKDNYSTRVIDLVSPIGKGQRALIVAPPKAGKTILLQNIIQAISANNPKVTMLVLLIDERPEEVTDMQRLIGNKGQVIASTFDEPPERHCVVAEMCIEKAKRLVEMGEDVVIVLDSITRLARAYNTVQPHSGRILSGGVDANAMHKPKRFFGAARNLEGGGSLTIIGSALIDTGSKMDEVIYEEFKGTGNLELVLDRRLADRRLYPAIDVIKSGTRKEDLLYHKEELDKIYKLRAALADLSPIDAMNLLLSRMKKTNNNTEFLLSMKD